MGFADGFRCQGFQGREILGDDGILDGNRD